MKQQIYQAFVFIDNRRAEQTPMALDEFAACIPNVMSLVIDHMRHTGLSGCSHGVNNIADPICTGPFRIVGKKIEQLITSNAASLN